MTHPSTHSSTHPPSGESLNWIITDPQVGQRLDKLLAEQFSTLASREQLKHWIQSGHILINDKPITKPAFQPTLHDSVTIQIPPITPLNLKAEDLSGIGLTVIYEDDEVLVVNKPSGMLTHPAGSQLTGTVVNGILHHCNGKLSSENSAIRPGIVHRLDRFTSGLLMVAKTNRAHRHLADQLKHRTAHRQYVALTHGVPPTPTGTINAPLGRNPQKRDQQIVDPSGRHAITHWTVLETAAHPNFAKVQFNLETGRTHQIRVHCQLKKFPIIGDKQYGDGIEKSKKLKTNGQCLQAQHIKFTHPITDKPMAFSLPLEVTLQQVWDQLNT